MSRYFVIKTLGCKANLFDSQRMEAGLRERGWKDYSESGANDRQNVHLCIVNSCTVTEAADKETKRLCARLAKEYPSAKIVLAGCLPEVDKAATTESVISVSRRETGNGVERLLQKAGLLATSAQERQGELSWPGPEAYAPPLARTRAFVKIQEGCNSYCSYCIVPFARGPSRSVSVDLVVDAIKRNVESGIKEVVLTGTHIGHFGKELTDRLTLDHLIKRILKETEIERLRLSSLHPNDISDELLGLMEEDRRLCPHIHISLQSPDTKILELMRRRYAWELVEDRLNKIAKLRVQEGPVFVGMDIIAGFSGETDADFESGVGRLRATPWTRLHVFPYSERRGTRALNLPGKVPVNERRRRAALLRALSMERQTETLQRWIDANPIISSVLVESEGKPVFTGTTPNYCRVIINDNSASIKRADVIKTRVTGLQSDTRAGEVALLAVPIES